METGSIVSWEKQEGDEVDEGDLLAEIETDKATVGFESSETGFLAKIILPAGTKDIALGTLVCIIAEKKDDVAAFANFSVDDAAEDSAPAPAVPAEPAAATPAAAPKAGPPAQLEKAKISFGRENFASPLAKFLAKDKGVNVSDIPGSGPGGRVIAADVASSSPAAAVPAMAAAAPPVHTPAPISTAPYEDIPLSSMRKTIANRLTLSKQSIPHYYLTVDVTMDKVIALRKKLNALLCDHKISVNDFIVKVCNTLINPFSFDC